MRQIATSVAGLYLLIAGPAVFLSAQPTQGSRPCGQITAACTAAGFTQGGAGAGAGLQVDCVVPIMQGIAQPAAATRPLPQVASQVVAACKASNPNFGQGTTSAGAPAPANAGAAAQSGSAASIPNGGVASTKTASDASRHVLPAADGPVFYDERLKVSWLSDGNLAATQSFGVSGINKSGSMDYETAVRWVQAMNAFNNGSGHLGHSNWQLPTTPDHDPECDRTGRHGEPFGFHCAGSALGSLYYNTLGIREPNTAVPMPSNTVGPFSNLQPYLYWSGSPAIDPKQGFVSFSFNTGFQGANVSRNHLYVLPLIRGKLPGTTSSATDGGLEVDASRQTVYDAGLRVTWLADANLAAKNTFGVVGLSADGSMDHDAAVRWIDAMNKADRGRGYLGQTHWELPETGPPDPSCSMKGTTGFDCSASPMGALYYKQLRLRRGESAVSTPNVRVGPFHNIQPYLYWACGADAVQSACRANGPADGFEWNFSFGNGFQGTNLVRNYLYVIVYYPGAPTSTVPK